MQFYIFVLILFFNSNHCDPIKVQHNQIASVNFKQQTLFVSTSLSTKNNSEDGRVEILETPLKSKYDKKSYRLIRLSNGLTALLVSTQHVSNPQKKSVCSLRIDVGSFSNPRDAQGLAHLVEHMIFMGSDKYPGENEFYEFIRKSEGICTAQTDLDDTSFEFETLEEYFDEALYRFSQLFEAPLMRKVSLLREREDVESEYALVKTDDNARVYQLLSSLGEPTHPSSIFQWGNSKTLKENIDDDELHRKTVEFRKRHYSAHRMYLCLQSNQSLDHLQEVVVRHFSSIPNNHMPGDDFSAFTHLNAFQSKFYEKIYFVKPIRSGSKIDITWCLEPMMKKFKSKHTFMLNYLLRREGKGSLLSYLRKNLWATELYAIFYTSSLGYNELFSMFNIEIRLTENGFDHLDDVLAAVFSYIKFLQHVDLDESIFHELRTARANVNRFSREIEAWYNVGNLTSNMIQYPSKYIVLASNNFFGYDAEALKKNIDKINSRKFNIMITLKRSKSKQLIYKSFEPWFGIKYMEMDVPVKWIELQQNAKAFPEFTLPEANPFISDNFTILKTDGDGGSEPHNLLDNGFCELWYRQSKKFSRPYAELYFLFIKPHDKTSIDTEIQMTLLAAWLNYQIVEKLYPASLVGIQYTCEQTYSYLRFHINGFNQKMYLAIDIFSKTLKSLANGPTEEQFNVFAQQQLEIYEKEILNPESVSKELHSSTIQSLYHPLWEKYKHLRSTSFFDFQRFCRSFCALVKIEAMVHGNIGKEHAIDIMQNILNNFQCERIKMGQSKASKPKKLPLGVHYLRVKNFNSNDANSVIRNFYQLGPKSCHTQTLLDLFEMIAQTPAFEFLRVKEQLSYDVSFDSHNDLEILGYSITVKSQETKFKADYVDERIEHFRRELLIFIEHMSLDDFDTYKKSLAKFKWILYDRSIESMEWNWRSDEDRFDHVSKDVEYLLTITKAQLLEFYSTHLDAKAQPKLSIQVIGNSQADEKDTDSNNIVESFDTLTYVNFTGETKGNLITDLREFKMSLENYKRNEIEDCYEEFLSNSVNARAITHFDIRAVYFIAFFHIFILILFTQDVI